MRLRSEIFWPILGIPLLTDPLTSPKVLCVTVGRRYKNGLKKKKSKFSSVVCLPAYPYHQPATKWIQLCNKGVTWCWWLDWYFCAWVPHRCAVLDRTNKQVLHHVCGDSFTSSRTPESLCHAFTALAIWNIHQEANKSFTSRTNSFLSSFVVVSGRKQVVIIR